MSLVRQTFTGPELLSREESLRSVTDSVVCQLDFPGEGEGLLLGPAGAAEVVQGVLGEVLGAAVRHAAQPLQGPGGRAEEARNEAPLSPGRAAALQVPGIVRAMSQHINVHHGPAMRRWSLDPTDFSKMF